MNTSLPIAMRLGAAALGLLAGAAASAGDETPQPLEPVTVTAPVPPLDRSLLLLRQLAASAPCLGCDAVLAVAQPAPGMALLQYLFAHKAPDQVDETTRTGVDVKLHDAPDLQYLKR